MCKWNSLSWISCAYPTQTCMYVLLLSIMSWFIEMSLTPAHIHTYMYVYSWTLIRIYDIVYYFCVLCILVYVRMCAYFVTLYRDFFFFFFFTILICTVMNVDLFVVDYERCSQPAHTIIAWFIRVIFIQFLSCPIIVSVFMISEHAICKSIKH